MLLINGRIVTFGAEPVIHEHGALRIQNGRITDVGSSHALQLQYPAEEVIDAGHQWIMPGNICAHTHFYGAFARGMAIAGESPRDFPEILQKLWWKLDRALLPEDVRYSALVCLIDAIRHGTTTLIDHHASPSCISGCLDWIAETAVISGLRICLCYEVTDRNGRDEAMAGIQENVRFLNRTKYDPHSLLSASFGLHASLTLSDDTLKHCAEEAERCGSGFHIHAAEGIADQEDSMKKSGKRVIFRLRDAGILGPQSILAHCVHVDPWEMEVIRDTRTWVTHQPRSNMNNAVGTAPVESMLRGGINVCMGNDGFSNNMWAEWKTAYLIHKAHSGDPRRGHGYDIMKMAVENNASLARVFWPDARLGEISPGACADLMIVDYHPFTEVTTGNLPWHILFGFEADMITGTMVNGEWLMRNRKLLTLDETAITSEARKLSRYVWERYGMM